MKSGKPPLDVPLVSPVVTDKANLDRMLHPVASVVGAEGGKDAEHNRCCSLVLPNSQPTRALASW